MAIELNGTLRMRGDVGAGVGVSVYAKARTLRLVVGNELIGDWRLSDIGIRALDDGFSIRAEGEEFFLRTEDDAALANELAIQSASPRLARRAAAKGNPDEPKPEPEPPPVLSNNLAALGMALAGSLIIAGGFFLNSLGSDATQPATFSTEPAEEGFDFWLAFVVGGVSMVALAYLMSRNLRVGRWAAGIVTLALLVVFGFAVTDDGTGTAELTAYGFVAGGLVVGVAVLSSASLRQPGDG